MKDLNKYIWKYKAVRTATEFIQKEYKMIDMAEKNLQLAYNHCKDMLYNNSKEDPGRYLVLDEISRQINNCSAELAVRWFCSLLDNKQNPKYSRFSLLLEIKTILEQIKPNYPEDHTFRLQDLYSGVPTDYNPVSVESLMKACKDTLGKFNKQHITKSFIIKQGIWFTSEELNDFKEIDKLRTVPEIIKTIKSRFGLDMATDLRLKSTGLNYEQFRGMMNIKINKKYSELTTNQLETLKNKILFSFEESVFFQINTWKTLMNQIEEVCEYKQFKLL